MVHTGGESIDVVAIMVHVVQDKGIAEKIANVVEILNVEIRIA